jgi:hypothetical protein
LTPVKIQATGRDNRMGSRKTHKRNVCGEEITISLTKEFSETLKFRCFLRQYAEQTEERDLHRLATMRKKPTTQFELDVYKAETERVKAIKQANSDLYRAHTSRIQLFLRFVLFSILGLTQGVGVISLVENWFTENETLYGRSVDIGKPAPEVPRLEQEDDAGDHQ